MGLRISPIPTVLFAATAMLANAAASADASLPSPVGLWRTVDDATGEAKSLVQIWEQGGALYGKITELVSPPEPNPVCDKCKGTDKDKPVVGMTVIRGLKKDGDEWGGGTVLDPESGNTYKCYLEVQDGGKKLKIRGFIGISLLGRTQYWHRVR